MINYYSLINAKNVQQIDRKRDIMNADTESKVAKFKPVEAGLEKLREVLKEVPDATTEKGYKDIKLNLKGKVALKKELVAVHKIEKADALAFCRLVDGEKNRILKEMDDAFAPHQKAKDGEDERKADIERQEAEAAAKRVADIQKRIEGFKEILYKATGKPSSVIETMLTALKSQEIRENLYGDFQAEAHAHKSAVTGKLENLLESTKSQEEIAEKLKVAEDALAAKQEEQRIEDDKRAEVQRKEDEFRAVEKEKSDKVERERVEKENAAMKEKLAVMEAKEKVLEEKQRKIDEKERLQREESDRIETDKKAAEQKIINSINAIHNFELEAKDCDTSEQIDAIIETVKNINPNDYAGYEKEAEDKKSMALIDIVATCEALVASEKVEKELEDKRIADEKKAHEEAVIKAKEEAVERRSKLDKALTEALSEHECDTTSLISAIENNEIPYVTLDWTKE